MRVVTDRAFAGGDRLMNGFIFGRWFLILVALVAESGLGRNLEQAADNAVRPVTDAALLFPDRLVNITAFKPVHHLRMTVKTGLGRRPLRLHAGGGTRGQRQQGGDQQQSRQTVSSIKYVFFHLHVAVSGGALAIPGHSPG